MPLSWNEIKSRAIEFSKEWEGEKSEGAEAQTFWNGFFNIFGLTRRRLASFEHEVEKRGGKKGYIDLFWPGTLIVEHKSLGKDLEAAHSQAMDYFPGLSEKELPKYILVSDFAHFKLYDLEEGSEVEFALKDLLKKVHLFGFLAGYKKQEYKEEDEVNIKAAELMGKLYDSMSESGYSGHDLNTFLVRILFCLFAEDARVFSSKGQLRRYVETRTNEDGSDLGMHLGMLFQVLNTPVEERQNTLDEELSKFEYVDGSLFEDSISLPSFTSEMRRRLLEACAFDWSAISPAIFGSLFQSVMDKEARRHFGAHYTSEKNILKLIKPLFLDELWAEFESCGKNAQKLKNLHEKISKLKFLDPACGCGNFLIIAFRELRLLELEILKKQQGTAVMLPLEVKDWIKIRPEQFYGIEIEEFPARIAETAMWLMNHQMNERAGQTFGKNIVDLPLTLGATIFIGNALQKNWEEIVPKNELSYILGNPPFVGSRMMEDPQRNDMKLVFGKIKELGFLDYVTAWYLRAAQLIQNTKIKCAFVSTNSITQGEQVGILWEQLAKHDIHIHFAHRTFKWSNEARGKAAVYCVIIGFANFEADNKFIYEYEDVKGEAHEIKAKNINAYLIDGDNVIIRNRQNPICKIPGIVFGNMPRDGGHLLFTDKEKKEFLKKEPHAEQYIKRFIGARDFLHNEKRWCLWLVGARPDELQKLPEVLKKVEQVKEFRLASKAESTRNFAKTSGLFAQRTQPDAEYILIPSTSSENRKYIPMDFMPKDFIVSNSCHAIPGATLYHFGILESEMHMAWVRHVCGRLENRFRYSKDIVYNNFPWFENPSAGKIKTVEEAAQAVLDVRAKYPTSSLADLYDPLTMPPDLVKAHQVLDRVVDSAYGKRAFKTDAERMNFLFDLYKKYTAD